MKRLPRKSYLFHNILLVAICDPWTWLKTHSLKNGVQSSQNQYKHFSNFKSTNPISFKSSPCINFSSQTEAETTMYSFLLVFFFDPTNHKRSSHSPSQDLPLNKLREAPQQHQAHQQAQEAKAASIPPRDPGLRWLPAISLPISLWHLQRTPHQEKRLSCEHLDRLA